MWSVAFEVPAPLRSDIPKTLGIAPFRWDYPPKLGRSIVARRTCDRRPHAGSSQRGLYGFVAICCCGHCHPIRRREARMFDILAVALLTALAVALNAFAARRADRSCDRRARMESDWHRMILRAMADTAMSRDE